MDMDIMIITICNSIYWFYVQEDFSAAYKLNIYMNELS